MKARKRRSSVAGAASPGASLCGGSDESSIPRFVACPDCAARPQGQVVHHDPTCPVDRGVNAAIDADGEWFKANPSATEYRRPITHFEQVELRITTGGQAVGAVHVLRLKQGRSRYFTFSGPEGPPAAMMLDWGGGIR